MAYATVSAVTSPQLDILRTAGQWSKLFLAFFKPTTIYSATLTSAPSSNDRVVQVSFTAVSGTLGNVRKDMTMYVGTTAGAYDLGMVRIRKTPIAGTFYIGETSEIRWNAGGTIYLTVVNEFDLWARHINTVSDTDFKMDYDVTYTNQNETFDPVPVMGGHKVVKLTGATVGTVWDFSNSWVIGSTISGYSVSCATASSITGSTTSTPTINFNSAGWHAVILTVTAANGKTYFGVRYVYVYSAASMPSAVFQLGECYVDYETGGWTFDVTIQSGATLTNVPERTMVILFGEDYYGTTKTSVGQLPGSENIIAVGKISDEHVTISPEQGEVTFTVQGMHYWFGRTNSFPVGLMAVSSAPTNWVEMADITVKKSLYYLLHWGSTATVIMDVYLPSDSRIATELSSPTGNLWTQIQEMAFTSIHARPGVDRFGRLFVDVEPQLIPVASRTHPTVMTLTKKDYLSVVTVERAVVSQTGRIDLSGIVAVSADDGEAFFSLSPGHVFKRYGQVEIIDRLLLSTQNLSNQEAGLFLGWRNNPYPSSEFTLSANNRMIDCFPLQRIAWSVSSGDSPRGFSLSGYFIPRRVSFSWDPETGYVETSLTLELESVEQLSADGDIPGESGPINIPPLPDFSTPIPDPVVIVPDEITDEPVMKALVMANTYGLFFSENFNELPGTRVKWRAINGGLTQTQYQNMNFILRNPYTGGLYVGKRSRDSGVYLAYAPYPGAAFTIIETRATIQAKFGTSDTNVGLIAVGVNPTSGVVGYVIGVNGTSVLYLGAGTSFTATNGGASFPIDVISSGSLFVANGGNSWVLTAHNPSNKAAVVEFDITGNPDPAVEFVPASSYACFAKTIDGQTTFFLFPFSFTANEFHVGATDGTSVITADDLAHADWDYQFDCDPSGTYCMTRWDTAEKGRSSDGMSSLQAIPALPPGGNYGFCYIGGAGISSHWAAAGGSVWYTDDFGDSWSDQRGNLLQLAPVGGYKIVKAWF